MAAVTRGVVRAVGSGARSSTFACSTAMIGIRSTIATPATAPLLLSTARLMPSPPGFHAPRPISTTTSRQRITIHATPASSPPQPLTAQRLQRPVSPHITIWRWQSHMLLSALQRNTGLLFAGPLYLFLIAYAVPHLPIIGASLTGPTSAGVVAAVAGLPWVLTAATKGVAAWAFSLHAVQGVNNLILGAVPNWALADKGRFVNVSVAVFGASTVLAGALLWWAA